MAVNVSDQKAIVFVTREGIQFFGTLSRGIASHPFDKKTVIDLDIVDINAFGQEIAGFIDQNKFPPCPVLFIFSDSSSFFLDVKEEDLPKLKQFTEEFVNTVPFDTVLTKVYKAKEGSRIISINEKMYRETAGVFESKGFLSLGVMPAFALGGKMAMIGVLDPESARQMLTNIELLRQQSFLVSEITEESEGEPESVSTKKPTIEKGFKITPGLIVLGVVFLILIVVFVIILTRQ